MKAGARISLGMFIAAALVLAGALALEALGGRTFVPPTLPSRPATFDESPIRQNHPALESLPAPSPSVDNFSDWLAKYLATGPDVAQLRHELEDGLARLSGTDRATPGGSDVAAIEALRRAEEVAGTDYRSLMDQAERFLEQFPHSPFAREVQQLFAKYTRAWDEHEYEEARAFCANEPMNFAEGIARYQRYIQHHAASGARVPHARAAIAALRKDWADRDYQGIYEFFRRYPEDIQTVASRVRRYVEEHPQGRHREAATTFLEVFERAATLGEYRVRVKSGSFDRGIGRSLSFGPDLAVEVEVGGIRIGRTPVVSDSYDARWDYQFPQRISWRLGDPITIRVVDLDYRNRTVLRIEPPADDPLAFRFLAGEIQAEGHRLVFESDFQVPNLPPP